MAALGSSTVWYVGSTKWTAVTSWAASTALAAGVYRRQLATPTVNNERVFVTTTAGTTGATEPTWIITRGGKTTDNTVSWYEVTGQAGTNGDLTNCLNWNAAKSNTVALGQIIQRISGVSLQICTTAGTAGSGTEPAFSNMAGVTTTDNTVTWTSLGPAPSPFAAPFARLGAPAAVTNYTQDSDTTYISNNHAETQTSQNNLNLTGSIGLPSKYICVVDTAAPPVTAATTASVLTSGAGNGILISGIAVPPWLYMYGVNFQSGDTSGAAAPFTFGAANFQLENCTLKMGSTNSTSNITIGNGGNAYAQLKNTPIVFSNAGQQAFFSGGRMDMTGGSIGQGTNVNVGIVAAAYGMFTFRDVDFSGVLVTLVKFFTTNLNIVDIYNCKLAAGISPLLSTETSFKSRLRVYNCDSAATNYRLYEGSFVGSVQSDTTTIVTGSSGASNGTTGYSRNMTSNANTVFNNPLPSPVLSKWNDKTGTSLTATIEIAGATTLTNADIWVELEYPSDATSPLCSTISSRATSILSTPANVTTSTATWAGSPAVTQKLQVTFTPPAAGFVQAHVYLAKPSTTVYYNPALAIA